MTNIDWLSVDSLHTAEIYRKWADHYNHPPLVNNLGCFKVMPDPMGIQDFLFPPFSGKGEGTGMLYINRKHPASEGIEVGYTWYPDRVVRRSQMEGLNIETLTRAPANIPGALIELTLHNAANETRNIEVGVKVAGRLLHTIEGWACIGPTVEQGWTGVDTDPDKSEEFPEKWRYEPGLGAMLFSSRPQSYSTHGSRPAPDRMEDKTLLYNIRIGAGERWKLQFVVALGESEEESVERYQKLINDFDAANQASRNSWQDKIYAAFTPENDIFSGHLPILKTDEEDLARLYYMTILGCLCCHRDNPISSYGAAYITLLPNYWTTATFLWDMMLGGAFYPLLDPDVLRKMMEIWMQVDIHNHLATDYVTGKPLGYWYAVNSPAIVRMAHDYLRWNGDFGWLDKVVAGKTVLDHLEHHARYWKERDKYGHGLADCGGVLNLQECVSTYTREVAAFNAMWVAALRQVAAMRQLKGETRRAQALEQQARQLCENTKKLYAKSKGFWRCRQPDGSYNDVRTIYDFIAVLESIAEDLPEQVQREMVEYFQENHQTGCWMRGLSTWDSDVHRSFRVDWQWTGCYPSMPAQVMNGLFKTGYGKMALDWLRRIAPIAHQGPLGQAHWVESVRPAFKGGAYKCCPDLAHMTDWTVASNGSWPSMFIESIFGCKATLENGLKWTDHWHTFDPGATLENLRFQDQLFNVNRKGLKKNKV